MLRVAIDLDGTYSRYPKYFATLAKGLQQQGAEVGILTARNADSTRSRDMRGMADDGWRPDFYYGKGLADRDTDPMTWKGQQMKVYRIDFLYDDFLTNQIRLWSRNDLIGGGSPRYGKSDGNINLPQSSYYR